MTLDQTLRFRYNLSRLANENLGVGGYDAPERAYSNENSTHNIRAQHFGPLGRRAFSRSRLQLFIADVEQRVGDARRRRFASTTSSPAAARSSPAASTRSGSTSRRISTTCADATRGAAASCSTAAATAPTPRRTISAPTPSTTWTRSSPTSRATTRGASAIRTCRYGNVQFGGLHPGRHPPAKEPDAQPRRPLRSAVARRRRDNIGPRFGLTWAPTASGQTTLRASTGIFYDWLATGTYEQSLRVDGIRQQELNIFDPSYPDPGNLGTIPPINKYLLDAGYRLPRITRISGGVDQGFLKVNRISATYSYQQGARLARGLNINATIDGVRPDPIFRNIVQAVSDAESRQHQVQIDGNLNPGAMLPAFKGPRISWKRTTLFINYQLTSLRNNTDGAFAIPASGNLTAEWGPAANDVRQRVNLSFNNQIVRNVLVGAERQRDLGRGLHAAHRP